MLCHYGFDHEALPLILGATYNMDGNYMTTEKIYDRLPNMKFEQSFDVHDFWELSDQDAEKVRRIIQDMTGKAIEKVYDIDKKERDERGLAARQWVTSKESNMSAKSMSQGFVDTMNQTFDSFKKRNNFELIKTQKLDRKKLVHNLTY
jgi:hypothetical protein